MKNLIFQFQFSEIEQSEEFFSAISKLYTYTFSDWLFFMF